MPVPLNGGDGFQRRLPALSADLLSPQMISVPSAQTATPGSGGVAFAGVAYLFGQALAATQTDEASSSTDAASSQTTDDTQAEASGTGELSPDLMAVLLGQQTPQPALTSAEAQVADNAEEAALAEAAAATPISMAAMLSSGIAEVAQAQSAGPAIAQASLVKSAPLLNLTSVMTEEAAGEADAVMPDDPMPGFSEDAVSPVPVKGEARSLSDSLQSLSGALTPQDSVPQVPAPLPAQAAANTALSQIQAQTLPQSDSGVRFTPAPPTAQETVQTYSQSAHAAENIAALSAQITRRLGSQSTRFDMELRPTDMGKVEVKLEIAHDGKMTAHLRFDNPVAESEFKGRQDDLRRQLEQAGFQMDEASLSFTSGDQGRGRQYTSAESSGYELPVIEPEAVSADGHSLIDAQLMAAVSADPTFYAQMSADGYGPARTLSLSVLV